METELQQEQTSKMTTLSGVVIKSIIGIFIAFFIAIPRLAQGKYFGEIFFRGGFLSDIIGSLIFTLIVGIIWFLLTNSLKKDKGVILNFIFYVITAVFSGIFLANSLIVATNIIGYYSNLNITDIEIALKIAGLATFIAVIAGILILPKIKVTGKAVKFANNAARIVLALALVSFSMYLLGNLLAFFGLNFLLNLYIELFYGTGTISIIFSIICVVLAEILFLGTLTFVKASVNNVQKHQEYYLAIVLVNGILRLYIEIFRLVLKLMGRRKQN